MKNEVRPIDANALSDEVGSLRFVVTGLRAGKGILGKWIEEYRKSVLRIIDEQQTISCQPAHIDREAWTAEWRELHGDKMVGLDDCGDDVYRHYHYSVCTSCGKGSAVKTHFCPSCGRAMTPEAWAELEKRLRG